MSSPLGGLIGISERVCDKSHKTHILKQENLSSLNLAHGEINSFSKGGMRKCGDGLPARPRGVTDAPSNLETPSVAAWATSSESDDAVERGGAPINS